MTINGKEVDFRISNLKHATAMQMALDEMGETEKKIQEMKDKTLVNVLGAMLAMFRKFFITATGSDVLEGCEDLQEARDAYESFLEQIKRQKASVLAPYSAERIK